MKVLPSFASTKHKSHWRSVQCEYLILYKSDILWTMTPRTKILITWPQKKDRFPPVTRQRYSFGNASAKDRGYWLATHWKYLALYEIDILQIMPFRPRILMTKCQTSRGPSVPSVWWTNSFYFSQKQLQISIFDALQGRICLVLRSCYLGFLFEGWWTRKYKISFETHRDLFSMYLVRVLFLPKYTRYEKSLGKQNCLFQSYLQTSGDHITKEVYFLFINENVIKNKIETSF